jgi:hypothetical protein
MPAPTSKRSTITILFCAAWELMDMEKQKGDGLRAFVVRFAMVLNSLDSFLCANKNDKHNFFPKHLSL